jgi:hypothetical protein
MHTTRGYYQLNQYHVADLRHQAQRGALARAARQARRARPHQSSHPSDFRRCARALLGRSHSIAAR